MGSKLTTSQHRALSKFNRPDDEVIISHRVTFDALIRRGLKNIAAPRRKLARLTDQGKRWLQSRSTVFK